jgi:hypothetical protein
LGTNTFGAFGCLLDVSETERETMTIEMTYQDQAIKHLNDLQDKRFHYLAQRTEVGVWLTVLTTSNIGRLCNASQTVAEAIGARTDGKRVYLRGKGIAWDMQLLQKLTAVDVMVEEVIPVF